MSSWRATDRSATPSQTTGDAGQPAGSPQTIDIAMPGPLTKLSSPSGPFDPRTSRVLPISGKSDQALRELAERYLAWLDTHGHDLRAERASADSLLSDMAWTASVGRDHFPHRAACRIPRCRLATRAVACGLNRGEGDLVSDGTGGRCDTEAGLLLRGRRTRVGEDGEVSVPDRARSACSS